MKKTPLIVLSLLFIYMLGHVTEASDWVLFQVDKEKKGFYDRESIEAITGDIKHVWVQVKYETPIYFDIDRYATRFSLEDTKKYLAFDRYTSSMLGLEEINCRNKQSRTLQLIFYFTNGENQPFSGDAKWRYVAADKNQNRLYRIVCNK